MLTSINYRDMMFCICVLFYHKTLVNIMLTSIDYRNITFCICVLFYHKTLVNVISLNFLSCQVLKVIEESIDQRICRCRDDCVTASSHQLTHWDHQTCHLPYRDHRTCHFMYSSHQHLGYLKCRTFIIVQKLTVWFENY